jgi:hypothetical protein
MRKCKAELSVRFLISQPKFTVKVVSAAGIKVLEL